MTIIYTPEQVAAANAIINADAQLMDYLNHEPFGSSEKWNHWNDGYQAAFEDLETAESVYRRLVGKVDPHDVVHTVPTNPLLPAIIPDNGVVQTEDGHFLAGPFFHSRDIGPWAVDLYDPPLNDPAARRVLTLEVDSRDHAQAMVDLMTWALGAGARTNDVVAA